MTITTTGLENHVACLWKRLRPLKKNLPQGEGDCKVIVVLSKRRGSKSETNKVKPIPEKDKHSQQVL